MNAMHVGEFDNVATALIPLKKGEEALGIILSEDIPQGHKFATAVIRKGEPVIKYDAHIGIATEDIQPGMWVHVHNIEGERGRGDIDTGVRTIHQSIHRQNKIISNNESYKLEGYRRSDGSFGFRNRILVIPSVHCANHVVEKIANTVIYSDVPCTEDTKVVYVTHQHGCSELSYDAEQTQNVLVGTGANPNVCAVLIVGLGCEGVPAREVAQGIQERAPYTDVQYFNIQESGGTRKSIAKGVDIVRGMLQRALACEKTSGTLADVVLGTECGGSDSFSGLSANPALGAASDIVIAHGGKVILAETTELIGAEHILARRAVNDTVHAQILQTIRGFEQEVIDSNADIRGANPSPGNIAGGLSSIEEKSLGCIYKAGHMPVVAVKPYAGPITDTGLSLMNTPGNDIEQLSGMVAGGCNVCVFTTGRGTPTGSAVTPTIKVASNTSVYHTMNDSIDINAGVIIENKATIAEVGEKIIGSIVEVSHGMSTKAEQNEQNDFSIWRLATTV